MANTVLITGSNRGIGLALARKFAEAGWTVFAGARDPGAESLMQLSSEFASVHPIALDVCSDESVNAAIKRVADLCDVLDVLVNNAAVYPGTGHERLEELDLDWFAPTFETNVVGVVRVTRAALPLLRKSSTPRIAHISSGAGSIGDKEDYDFYAYGPSKAALNHLTRGMAAEFRDEGIVVTAFSPGWVRTDMGGENAPLTAEESAAALCKTISSLTAEQSGLFLSRDGSADEYPW